MLTISEKHHWEETTVLELFVQLRDFIVDNRDLQDLPVYLEFGDGEGFNCIGVELGYSEHGKHRVLLKKGRELIR